MIGSGSNPAAMSLGFGTGLVSGVADALGLAPGDAEAAADDGEGPGLTVDADAVGDGVAAAVGDVVGAAVGAAVGVAVGCGVGLGVGAGVGRGVGGAVGRGVGVALAVGVGAGSAATTIVPNICSG